MMLARAWMTAVVAVLAAARAGVAQPPPSPTAPAPGNSLGAGDSGSPPAISAPSPPPPPASVSIQSLVRLAGQGKTPLRGMGLVLGLNGTGDQGKDLVLARPLAQVYANNGNPIGDLRDLANAKTVALVMLHCEIPAQGARMDDTFDVFVTASHSATSLAGGRLLISPLLGPLPGQEQAGPMGFAEGPVIIEETANPRVGRIRGGAKLVQDIRMLPIGNVLTLIVNPEKRSWATARTIANEINGATGRLDDETAGAVAGGIARALDEMTIAVAIPEQERSDPANFIARILSLRFSPTLLDQAATVVVNERTGVITMSADVDISPGAVSYKDMMVTTTVPAPTPTPQNPLVQNERWVGVGTSGRASERARLSDLLKAMNQLNVPPRDQIYIITQLHDSGRLHARLIVE